MKKSQLKSLVKTIIKEMDTSKLPLPEPEDDICGLCGQPGADKYAHPEHWPGEQKPDRPLVHTDCEKEECERAHHEFMAKVGEVGVDKFLKSIRESTEPSIGGSYGDQQTGVDGSNVRPERDPLTDPMLTGKPLKEYSDSEKRTKALQSRPDDALKLIFMWVKQGTIDYREFEKIVNEWADSTDNLGMS